MKRLVTRREVLRVAGMSAAALPFGTALVSACTRQSGKSTGRPYEGTDEQLLDEIQKASFEFFWNEAGTKSGQVRDRANATTPLKPKEGLNGAPGCSQIETFPELRSLSRQGNILFEP